VEEADAAGRDVYLTTLQRTNRFYEPQGFSEVSPTAIPRYVPHRTRPLCHKWP